MNVKIEPFKVLVKKSFLYNGDENQKGFVEGEIIGVSSYLNQTLTFHCLIQKQFLFSDLPVNSFVSKEVSPRVLSKLCYSNCQTLEIDVFKFDFTNISVYFKDEDKFEFGKYILSIDFYNGNDLQHLINLQSGEFCLMPNHKINFDSKTILTDYKKNRQNFSV